MTIVQTILALYFLGALVTWGIFYTLNYYFKRAFPDADHLETEHMIICVVAWFLSLPLFVALVIRDTMRKIN